MNRGFTNKIRFIMDECIPPVIRDTRWFMYPFYYLAYRGKNIREVMDFKKNVYAFTPEKYDAFYNGLNSISRNRKTDMNKACLDYILTNLDPAANSLIDVGCGLGYFLDRVKEKYPAMELFGFDIKEPGGQEKFTYVKGNIERLPFDDKAFDIVVSSHTIEHLVNLEQCMSELVRITRKQLIIVTPCQRYYYYTLDEHVNFFPQKEDITRLLSLKKQNCIKLSGDWLYVGTKEN